MRKNNIKKVYYIQDSILVCEKVQQMASIMSSHAGKTFDQRVRNYPKNDVEYYSYLLKNYCPDVMGMKNIEIFINHNLTRYLKNCRYEIKKGKFLIYNEKVLVKSIIIS